MKTTWRMRRLHVIVAILLLLASCKRAVMPVAGAVVGMSGVAVVWSGQQDDSSEPCTYGCGGEMIAPLGGLLLIMGGAVFMVAGLALPEGEEPNDEHERAQELAAQRAAEQAEQERRDAERRREVDRRRGVWRDVPPVANEE